LLWIGAEVWELLQYADLYQKGLPPIVGGALDQSASFVAACRYIWAEQAARKADAGIMDD